MDAIDTCALILKSIKSTTVILISFVRTYVLVHCNMFPVKQKKKQLKLEVKNFLLKLTTCRDEPVNIQKTRQG